MALIFDQKLDKTHEGTWTTFEGSRFKIAHSGNVKFQRSLSRLQLPHRKKIDKGTIDPQTSKEIVCEAMSEGLVLDWENVKASDGSDVKFSKENCKISLLNHDDLREFVQEFSSDLENFKNDEIERQGNV